MRCGARGAVCAIWRELEVGCARAVRGEAMGAGGARSGEVGMGRAVR